MGPPSFMRIQRQRRAPANHRRMAHTRYNTTEYGRIRTVSKDLSCWGSTPAVVDEQGRPPGRQGRPPGRQGRPPDRQDSRVGQMYAVTVVKLRSFVPAPATPDVNPRRHRRTVRLHCNDALQNWGWYVVGYLPPVDSPYCAPTVGCWYRWPDRRFANQAELGRRRRQTSRSCRYHWRQREAPLSPPRSGSSSSRSSPTDLPHWPRNGTVGYLIDTKLTQSRRKLSSSAIRRMNEWHTISKMHCVGERMWLWHS